MILNCRFFFYKRYRIHIDRKIITFFSTRALLKLPFIIISCIILQVKLINIKTLVFRLQTGRRCKVTMISAAAEERTYNRRRKFIQLRVEG